MNTIHLQEADIELQSRGMSLYAHLDKRRPNKKGTFPVRIRLTFNRTYRDYGTRQTTDSYTWKQLTLKRPKGSAAELKIKILALLERAYSVLISIDPFSFEEFNAIYMNKQNSARSNIYNWYYDKIKELKKNNQVGTAMSYKYSMKSLQDFSGENENLTFDKITAEFLKKYEKWAYSKEKSPTTVGIYLRPLRHLFNLASRYVKEYPFDNYKIPSPRNIKKALTLEQIKSIYEYGAMEGSPEAFYKDIWMFSYFANGINIKDICRLKYSNIKGNTIEFRRAKTARTIKNSKPISIVLTDDLKRIIKEYGIGGNGYIFNFLKEGMSAEKEMNSIKQATKQTNKYIKRIAEQVGIEVEVSTYSARHSFATILKNSGVSPHFIGESLGHTSLKTTESYLGSFETDQKEAIIDKLKDW